MSFLDHLIALIDLFAPTPPAMPPAPSTPPATAGPASVPEVVRLLNLERSKAGLAPLVHDFGLDGLAVAWSRVMAKKQSLEHGNFAGRIATVHVGTGSAEDIAMGYPAAAAVVAGWTASPPHRANILGPYNVVGVGSAVDRAGQLYWTADFERWSPR